MWAIPSNLEPSYNFNEQANTVTHVVKLLILNWVQSLFKLSFQVASKRLCLLLHLIPTLSKISQVLTHNILLHRKSFLLTHWHTILHNAKEGVRSIFLPNATGSCFQQGLSSVPNTKVHLNLGRVIQNIEGGVTQTCIQLPVYPLRSLADLLTSLSPNSHL